jgi:hypothetical protein
LQSRGKMIVTSIQRKREPVGGGEP